MSVVGVVGHLLSLWLVPQARAGDEAAGSDCSVSVSALLRPEGPLS